MKRMVSIAIAIVIGISSYCRVSAEIVRQDKSKVADRLPSCTWATCFNRTRCIHNQKVFVYDQENPRLDKEDVGSLYYGFLPRTPNVSDPLYTNDPEEACLFAVYIWSEEYDYAELPSLQYWNGGENHIIIDFIPRSLSQRGNISANIIGKAALAKSFTTVQYYRPMFDLPVPVLKLSRTKANIEYLLNHKKGGDRKYFLTFKGTTYLNGTAGSYRWELLNVKQSTDVVILLQCFKMHGWHKTKQYNKICRDFDNLYTRYNYLDLLNSTFALVPGGRQPATYRLIEALYAGALPVFVYPEVDWVKPYSHIIDWDEISFTFTPNQIPQILSFLRNVSPDIIETMRSKANQVYKVHFATPEQMAQHLFEYALQQFLATPRHCYQYMLIICITIILLALCFVYMTFICHCQIHIYGISILIIGLASAMLAVLQLDCSMPLWTVPLVTASSTSANQNNPLSIQHKVTLVLINHARPDNVKRIISKAIHYKVVDEIILWDDPANLDDNVNMTNSKLSVIRASEMKPMDKWGLLGRFKWALLARNEHIFIQDDDQLLYESEIIKLLEIKKQDPDRLICYFGREVVGNGDHITYLTHKAPAPSHPPICLTKSVLTDRRFCLEATRYAPIVEDLAIQGIPYWNGEDIWHSLVAINITGKLHTVIPIDYKRYKLLKSSNGISDNKYFNHTSFRKMFTREAASRLGLSVDTLRLQPIN